jgi:secreted trypsin-like serine protease
MGLSAAACGGGGAQQAASDVSIVGGERVTSTDVLTKSTVALVTPYGDQFCTGTLIGAKTVLTATHCLADYSYSQLYIAFGTVARNGSFASSRLRKAASWKTHASYSETEMNRSAALAPPFDIALVKLEGAAPSAYRAVPLLRSGDAVQVGETLTLAGYGRTRYDRQDGGVLYKVETSLTAVDATAKEIHFGGHPGKSACMGDSGGPAYVVRNGQLALLGVTSRGSSVCDEEGIYTDVRAYGAWIAAAMR